MSDWFGTGKGRVDNTDESTAEVAQALQAYLPSVLQTMRGQYQPQAQAEIDVAKMASPQLNNLAIDLLGNQGRKISAIGRELGQEEGLTAAETENKIISGTGADTARKALALQKEYDPEYFQGREKLLDGLSRSFAALGDPNKLSKTESEGVARGLGRTNWNVGSPTQTYLNAMTFGNNQASRRAELNTLNQTAAGAIPTLKSGLDAGSVATRRTYVPNFGQSQYQGIQTPGVDTVNTTGNNMMNNIFETDRNRQRVYAEMQKGKGIGTGTMNSIMSVAAIAGCWVAREVYGEDNPRWRVFRSWLFNDAPKWLYHGYMNHGKRVAGWLKRLPMLKLFLRPVMDLAVNSKLK
jgi:hypothetical protein